MTVQTYSSNGQTRFASHGDCWDNEDLHASADDISRYAGRSALTAMEALEVRYVHRRSWYICGPCDAVAVQWVWQYHNHR